MDDARGAWCSTTDNFEKDGSWGQCATSIVCTNSYSTAENTGLLGGVAQPTAQSVSECMEICDTDTMCLGFHYDNRNDVTPRCFTASVALLLNGAAGVTLYVLTNRCNTGELSIVPLRGILHFHGTFVPNIVILQK